MDKKICNNIICVDNKPKEYGKLFFGDGGNFNRIDLIPHEIFKKLADLSQDNTWFMTVIDFSPDKRNWNNLSYTAQRLFNLTLDYQTLMDSAVPNIYAYLTLIANDTYLKYCYSRILTEEEIHSMSYSSGISQMFGAKASEILDQVYINDELKNRIKPEQETAAKFIKNFHEYYDKEPDDEYKKSLIELLLRTMILEGIKFPFSFLVTWSINKAFDNAIQGFSQLLKLIAHDELSFHLPVHKNVFTILRNHKNQGFQHLIKSNWFKELTVNMVQETIELEDNWIDYLFCGEDGLDPIPALNDKICKHFIRYRADLILKMLKLDPIYNVQKNDVIEWYDLYRDLNKVTVAQQEAKGTNYRKGALVNDFDKNEDKWEYLKTFYK